MSQTVKQVIVMRKDLNMRKGKMIAQGAHASLKVFLDMAHFKSPDHDLHGPDLVIDGDSISGAMTEWLENSFTKICVSVSSEEQLVILYNLAKQAGLPCSLIQDMGKTEFDQPTLTCCAIGPAYSDEVDKITGALPLL